MPVAEEKSGAESDGAVCRHRRRRSEAQKRQIVAESHELGASVSIVAQRYNVKQVFTWRQLYREPGRNSGSGGFVPVVVRPAQEHEAGTATVNPPSIASSSTNVILQHRGQHSVSPLYY